MSCRARRSVPAQVPFGKLPLALAEPGDRARSPIEEVKRCRNLPVLVPQHVTDAGNLSPREGRISGLYRRGQMAAGLGYNLNSTLHNPLLFPVLLERFKRRAP